MRFPCCFFSAALNLVSSLFSYATLFRSSNLPSLTFLVIIALSKKMSDFLSYLVSVSGYCLVKEAYPLTCTMFQIGVTLKPKVYIKYWFLAKIQLFDRDTLHSGLLQILYA